MDNESRTTGGERGQARAAGGSGLGGLERISFLRSSRFRGCFFSWLRCKFIEVEPIVRRMSV